MICGFVYDEAEGWPEDNIAPGTRWEDVPVDWFCPDCGVGKDDFEMIDIGPAGSSPTIESTEVDEALLVPAPEAIEVPASGPSERVWQCIICGFVYAEGEGWPEDDIVPGTCWEDLPESWLCPECGAGKGDFQVIEIAETGAAVTSLPGAGADQRPIVIIGSGLAGYNLVRELRKLDSVTPVVLVTRDDGRYYTKPLLSIGFTQGKTADELASAGPDRMMLDYDLRVLDLTPVTAIDTERQIVHTDKGEIAYTSLVLAVGAQCVELALSGDGLDRVHHVNDLMDYTRFRQALSDVRNVLVIGAGLIGCEYANDLGNGGFQVAVVDPLSRPLATLLPEAASRALQRGLETLGIAFHFGVTVASVNHRNGVLAVGLSDGSVIETEMVLSAVGIRPNLDLARAAGLPVNRGIVVNRVLQSVVPNIYALGDCAEVDGRVLNFVMPLSTCARALARTLAGCPTDVHYGAMPVIVKTPACPVVVSPPASGAEGHWRETVDANNVKALFVDGSDVLLGFALTGEYVVERGELSQQVPDIMP